MRKMNKTKELAEHTAKLALFTRRGVPMAEIIRNIRSDLKDPSLKEAFDRVADSASKGGSFWVSLESAPPIYPDYIKAMIQAGEEEDHLAETLDDISRYLAEKMETAEMAEKAVRHPLIPVNFLCFFTVFAFYFLTPMVVDLYGGMSVALPLPTKVIIFLAQLFRNPQFLVLYFSALAGFNIILLITDPLKNKLLEKISISGNVIRKYYTYLMARLTSLMMRRGLTAEFALNAISSEQELTAYKDTIVSLVKELEKGKPMGSIIEQFTLFPPTFRWMLENMKDEGELEKVLQSSAEYYRKDLETLQVRSNHTLSGVYVLALGGVLFIAIVSLFLPLYQIIGTLN